MKINKVANWAVVLLALSFGNTTWAQDEAAPAAPDKQTAQAAYDKAEGEYQEVLKEIVALRSQFEDSDDARRKEINTELQPLIAKAREKVANWTMAALDLYKAAPNENEDVSNLLVGMSQHLVVGSPAPGGTGGNFVGGDQFEEALPIIKALIEGGHPEKSLYLWGGVAAVCVGEIDTAEKYLNQAKESGAMGEQNEFTMQAMSYLQNIETFRKEWEAEQKIREAEAKADNLPRVKFTTTKGEIVIELFEDQAPIATANMITLVKDGFYKDVVFHRVLPHFMAQGGDPTGTGSGGPGYSIPCECYEPDARKHFRGTISMAHAGRDTGGSQFFLCFVPTNFLNGRHTAFGRVVEGIEVLGKLQRIDPSASGPFPTPDKILKAEVIRDRGHAYDFDKLPER
ncbi:peptidylprolyl isomerase [Aeoliella mucimassa]|uniref:peptidylprolyl isomerase n=1 Tax=Aeoliella mucimassa TaxID=2527972 RepID=A0A518ATP5_9BACT|nr:peptidylprolyl isomerase [Aeoliella mucimassa]QDU58099.1 putative peptidyl-prolyl cis-trans isomerase [Aeoliella mucimassa]